MIDRLTSVNNKEGIGEQIQTKNFEIGVLMEEINELNLDIKKSHDDFDKKINLEKDGLPGDCVTTFVTSKDGTKSGISHRIPSSAGKLQRLENFNLSQTIKTMRAYSTTRDLNGLLLDLIKLYGQVICNLSAQINQKSG